MQPVVQSLKPGKEPYSLSRYNNNTPNLRQYVASNHNINPSTYCQVLDWTCLCMQTTVCFCVPQLNNLACLVVVKPGTWSQHNIIKFCLSDLSSLVLQPYPLWFLILHLFLSPWLFPASHPLLLCLSLLFSSSFLLFISLLPLQYSHECTDSDLHNIHRKGRESPVFIFNVYYFILADVFLL